MSNYTVLSFGRELILTQDLDPIYVMLTRAEREGVLSRAQVERFCLAYWCVYHAPTAARLAIGRPEAFWSGLAAHVATPASARGVERRHFRGDRSTQAVLQIAGLASDPSALVRSLLRPRKGLPGLAASDVSRRVQAWPMFGPWIAWKVADMCDRVLGVSLDWTSTDLSMYDAPRQGALLVAREESLRPKVSVVVEWLTERLGDLTAPPSGDRPIGPAEVETVLCKYKSHKTGHYPMGKDSEDLYRALSSARGLEELSAFVPGAP